MVTKEDEKAYRKDSIAVGVELMLVIFYAVSAVIGYRNYLVYLPALVGCVITLCTNKRVIWIGVALLFSALGDYAGMQHNFYLQVAFFALGHLSYILFFSRCFSFSKKRLAFVLLVVAEFVALALVVLPRVNHLMEFVFVVMYMIVIASMGVMSVLNNYTARYMLIIASQLFIISDSLIAVSRFVTHIPNAGFWILLTYYMAQGLFFWSALRISGKKKQ